MQLYSILLYVGYRSIVMIGKDWAHCCIAYAGLPGMSVPCGYDEQTKMPVGVQFIGQAFGETALLQTAHIFEQTLSLQRPTPEERTVTASG